MDTLLFYAINGLAGRFDWLDAFMTFWAHPSPGWLGLVLAIAAWAWFNWWEALFGVPTVSSAVAIADAIGAQLKHLVQRPRPCLVLPDATVFGQCGALHSFPSNHAINSATIAAFLHVVYPKSAWVTWPLVGLIGVARVFTGSHYVGDVVGGWAIGIMMGAGAAFLLLRWRRFRPIVPETVSPPSNGPMP